MRPVSRRALLGWGGILVERRDLLQPQAVHSSGGELRVRLRAASSQVRIGGLSGSALTYNETLPGPTLRFRAGERLRIDLENRLGAATNLHVHGLHVSPAGAGDNPLRTILPGDSFDYRIPENHPPGIY